MKPKVLLVGTYHFASKLDMVSHEDTFDEENDQDQIQALTDILARFKPTALAVEITKDKQKHLNDEYRSYLSGTFSLEANEVHQVMYQLGERLGLAEINAVDWMDSVGNRGMGDVVEWAKVHQPDTYEAVYNMFVESDRIEDDNTIIENLRLINDEENIRENHQAYMKLAQIGVGTEYVGIDWMRWWYQRNLIIYKNVMELVEGGHDRVLLYIGAAHLHLLKQFLTESGEVEVVSFNGF
ncbi:DUF5694 domain-containing protein [Salinicoccus roseus]|uniref:DUF5694 domain-containing protein n=1 Tax=Salinicoccus roseus TaxID=45670 RepID=UPI000F4E2101|nr:DUF5694 domain-containing protein [Salinicoccus roseus]RPE51874.1 hypothetical protein EDC33_2090 [Salinicoccus roseus]GGA75403.1 hypothetical protein GCM10007176_19580 [Salinicoccus roseus]